MHRVSSTALAFAASTEAWTLAHDKARSPTGFVGLRNLGCTCYMNALFQQLFMVKKLRMVRATALDACSALSSVTAAQRISATLLVQLT